MTTALGNRNGGIVFHEATKESARLRLALMGPAGSGKTYTALRVATGFGGRVAVLDTERGSASKYAGLFGFHVVNLSDFHPARYVEVIHAAAAAGFATLVIDSLSHAWIGKNGGLDLHDQAVARQRTKNSFTAWAEVTPHHQDLIEAIVQAPLHVIATMRSKTEYVQEKDERSGKTSVRKVGTAPMQREGMEFEFDVVGEMTEDNTLVVGKTRCPELSRRHFPLPGDDFTGILRAWLGDPAPAASAVATAPARPAERPAPQSSQLGAGYSRPAPHQTPPPPTQPAPPERQPGDDDAELVGDAQLKELRELMGAAGVPEAVIVSNYCGGGALDDLYAADFETVRKKLRLTIRKKESEPPPAPAAENVEVLI